MDTIQRIEELLQFMARKGVITANISPGVRPTFIRDSETIYDDIWTANFPKQDCQRLIFSVLNEEQQTALLALGEYATEFNMSGAGRFRMEARWKEGAASATIQLIERKHVGGLDA